MNSSRHRHAHTAHHVPAIAAALLLGATAAQADNVPGGDRYAEALDQLVEERLERNLVHAMPAIDEWSLIEHWLVAPPPAPVGRPAGRVYFTAAFAERVPDSIREAPTVDPGPALLFAGLD